MRILVIGGTGTVGSAVTEALLARGVEVRVMARAPGDRPGVEHIVGDLGSPESLVAPFHRIDGAYMLTPLSQSEVELGVNGVNAAREAGVRHFVFQSVYQADEASFIPHFGTKVEIVQALRDSGVPYTVLEPNNFFQNDLWLREPIVEHSVYASPVGNVGLSRVDVRDIADAAATALLEPGHEGRTYPLVGPDVLTGNDCAEIWGRHLSRDVQYGGDDLDAWAEQAGGMMPEWLVEDVRIMFEYFQEQGLAATEGEVAELTEVLGAPPRSFDDFAAEVAAGWLSAAH